MECPPLLAQQHPPIKRRHMEGKPRPRDGGRTTGPLHGLLVPLEVTWAWEVVFTEIK